MKLVNQQYFCICPLDSNVSVLNTIHNTLHLIATSYCLDLEPEKHLNNVGKRLNYRLLVRVKVI